MSTPSQPYQSAESPDPAQAPPTSTAAAEAPPEIEASRFNPALDEPLDFSEPRRRGRWIVWTSLIVVLLLMGGTAWFVLGALWAPVQVKVVKVDEGLIEQSLTEDGVVRPVREAQISAEIAGRIKTIEVEEGQRVEAGQVLFTIAAEHLEARIPAWQAQQEYAQRVAAEAESRRAFQQSRLARIEKLREKSAADEQEYEEALSQYQMADAQYEAALADIRRIDSELARTRVELDRSVVRAPFAGVVDSVELDVGEMVAMGFGDFSAGAADVLTLVDTSDLYIEAEIAEADVGLVRVDQRVQITSDALPEQAFAGRVSRVQLHARPKQILTRYERAGEEKVFLADVDLEESGGRKEELRPGLTVYVTINVASRTALRLSRAAVFAEGDDLVAYVVSGDRLQRRVLRVGLQGTEYVEVLGGLHAGETVALRTGEVLVDGQRVEVVAASTETQ